MAAVMAPKADGAWRLHQALHRADIRPDFFVLYSSMSAVLGSPGQGNYVAANAFLDALARRRVVSDLPATSIAWGAWKDVGMAARGQTVERAASQGLQALSAEQGMQALSLLLRDGIAAVGGGALRLAGAGAPARRCRRAAACWRTWWPMARSQALGRSRSGARRRRPASTRPRSRSPTASATSRRWCGAKLATVLGLPAGAAAIVDDQAFSGMGLDSLTALELRNRLQTDLGRPVAATAAFEWPTVVSLATHLSSLFDAATPANEDASREELTL